jgi:hypothetical protein
MVFRVVVAALEQSPSGPSHGSKPGEERAPGFGGPALDAGPVGVGLSEIGEFLEHC